MPGLIWNAQGAVGVIGFPLESVTPAKLPV